MTDWWLMIAAFWLVCSFLSWGILFGYYQLGYPEIAEEYRWHNRTWCIGLSLVGGPFALAAFLMFLPFANRRFKGFKWW